MSKSIPLNNGLKIPTFGLGTYQGEGLENVVQAGIDLGYRLFDSAYVYQNEAQIGEALSEKLKDGSVKREDLFIVTKVWNTHHKPEDVFASIKKSLSDLKLEYVDLFLMHWPVSWKKIGDGYDIFNTVEELESPPSLEETWKAMEECVKLGYTKSIGLSNFNSQQIERIIKSSTIKPVVNQVEVNPYFNQKKLIAFCKERGIVVMAYSPFYALRRLGCVDHGLNMFEEPILKELAAKYNKTVPQIILKYLVQIGTVPVPKTDKIPRLQENIDIFDFTLSSEDVEKVDSLNRDLRCTPLEKSSKMKEYPFDIEY